MLNKKLEKNKKKSVSQTILIADNYFDKRTKFTNSAIIKLVIAIIVSISSIMALMSTYGVDFSYPSTFLFSLIFTMFFCFAFTFINNDLVALGFFATVIPIILVFYKNVKIRLYFSSYVLHFLDSEYLETAKRAYYPASNLVKTNQEYIESMTFMLVFFSYFISFIIGYFVFSKFKVGLPAMVLLILFMPAFISLKPEFNWYYAILFTAFLSIYATNTTYSYFGEFITKKSNSSISVLPDKLKPKGNIPWYKRNFSKIIATTKYQGITILVAVITLISLIFSSFIFEEGSSVKYDKLYKWVSDLGLNINIDSDIKRKGPEVFSKYFSTEHNGINNTLGIDSPGNGDREVLRVITDSNPHTKYLRGDIGVKFENNAWTSVVTNDEDDYNNSSFFPEYITCVASAIFDEATNYQSDKVFKAENIEIEYLMDTDVLLLPTSMVDFSLVNNQNLKFMRDTVVRSENNHIDNISLPVYYPIGSNNQKFNEIFDYLSEDYEEVAFAPFLSNEMLLNYKANKQKYDNYVLKNYLHVPADFQNYLKTFIYTNILNSNDEFPNNNDSKLKFSQAMKVNDYLKYNYAYSLDAINDMKNQNPIFSFLEVSKSGHCALYASSMVLLMRTMGYPARYVTGFLTGENGNTLSDGRTEYILQEKNLHAWVEVYFEELGWIPFDPTGFANDSSTVDVYTEPKTEQTLPETTIKTTDSSETKATENTISSNTTTQSTTTDSTSSSEAASNDDGINDTLIILILLLSLLLIVAVLAIVLVIVANKTQKNLFHKFKNNHSKKTISHMYSILFKLLYLKGFCPEENELPEEFARRMQLEYFDEKENVDFYQIMMIFLKNEFSEEVVTEEEKAKAYDFLVNLYGENVLSSNTFVRIFYKLIVK